MVGIGLSQVTATRAATEEFAMNRKIPVSGRDADGFDGTQFASTSPLQ
jgi:hypothetical protein